MRDRTGDFLALLFRQKDINRWGLMRNLSHETLSEHCYEVAIVAHCLAVIGNKRYGKSYDANKIATSALYHDMSEILTGDLPTPVKYYNSDIKNAYKNIERVAEGILVGLLADDVTDEYKSLIQVTEEEKKIIKAADKLCAYIKCLDELSVSNREFICAERSLKAQLNEIDLPEARYFIDNYLDSFTKPLDDITL